MTLKLINKPEGGTSSDNRNPPAWKKAFVNAWATGLEYRSDAKYPVGATDRKALESLASQALGARIGGEPVPLKDAAARLQDAVRNWEGFCSVARGSDHWKEMPEKPQVWLLQKHLDCWLKGFEPAKTGPTRSREEKDAINEAARKSIMEQEEKSDRERKELGLGPLPLLNFEYEGFSYGGGGGKAGNAAGNAAGLDLPKKKPEKRKLTFKKSKDVSEMEDAPESPAVLSGAFRKLLSDTAKDLSLS